jgi:hypothetical protein
MFVWPAVYRGGRFPETEQNVADLGICLQRTGTEFVVTRGSARTPSLMDGVTV